MPTINYNGTPEDVRRLLRLLPAILAGKAPDPYGIARAIQLRVANTVLSLISQAFLVKSRGGTGSDGIEWKKLLPSTIAQRRTTRGERKAAGISEKNWKNRTRGLLTPDQNAVWRKKYAGSLAWLRLDMPEKAARARAAQIAWKYVKEEMGAKTMLEEFGKRVVDIGRDTGRLLKSLSAGVEDQLSGAPGQIVRVPTGRIIVGTNVEYAGFFHKSRPLWPIDNSIPVGWWPAINRSILRGIQAAVKMILEHGEPIP